MSSLFRSTTIKGTRLTDFSGTSAEVGRGIAFGYGAYPVDGIVNWAPLPPVEHRQVKRQGKGGVKQETFTYTLSYGVLFCKGPIYGFRWIKRNGKVVYTTDPNAPLEDKQYAAKWAQRVNFHYGTANQLPDSLIESYEGAGNVSAFVNFCYMTIEDEDVTDNGGAPPNYEAVVIAGGVGYVSSPPYVMEDVIDMEVNSRASAIKNVATPVEFENFSVGASPVSIENRLMRQIYNTEPATFGVLATPVSIENKKMQTVQQVKSADFGTIARPVEIENKQIRVVLDKNQTHDFGVSSTPVSIEVVIP